MGEVHVFGIPERAGNSKFSLYDPGLIEIEVLSSIPKEEQTFRKYFTIL